MTTERFSFQRECVERIEGVVLNVGANEDPAHLKDLCSGVREVINCDIWDRDEVMDRPNAVDVLFDCVRDSWPFDNDSVALTVMGDIIEHLRPDEIEKAFEEARRVSYRLCITCPEDGRPENCSEEADKYPRGAVHRTVVTSELLDDLLYDAGWDIVHKRVVDYGFVPVGYFVLAERNKGACDGDLSCP